MRRPTRKSRGVFVVDNLINILYNISDILIVYHKNGIKMIAFLDNLISLLDIIGLSMSVLLAILFTLTVYGLYRLIVKVISLCKRFRQQARFFVLQHRLRFFGCDSGIAAFQHDHYDIESFQREHQIYDVSFKFAYRIADFGARIFCEKVFYSQKVQNRACRQRGKKDRFRKGETGERKGQPEMRPHACVRVRYAKLRFSQFSNTLMH